MRLRIKVGLNQSRTWSTTTVSVHNQYIKRKKWHQHGVKTGGLQPYTWPPVRKVGGPLTPRPPGSPPLGVPRPPSGCAHAKLQFWCDSVRCNKGIHSVLWRRLVNTNTTGDEAIFLCAPLYASVAGCWLLSVCLCLSSTVMIIIIILFAWK